MTSSTQKSATKHLRRMARQPKPQQSAEAGDEAGGAKAPDGQNAAVKVPKGPSKNEAVLALLRRPEGATLEQMVEATRWQAHTTRAVLTGFKKKGHSITSEKVDGVRTYRVASAAVPV